MNIPRHQTVLFVLLLIASIAMGVVLWQLRERAHQRVLDGQDSAPTQAPAVAAAEEATLLVANDNDGSMLNQVHSLPLPQDPGARARAVLGKLLDIYAAPGATHPVPGGASAILQVFLLPIPATAQPGKTSEKPATATNTVAVPLTNGDTPVPADAQAAPEPTTPLLAVVNLTGSFANNHPSGLETETLTVLSLCGTLHANLPRVTQVRFLVDGQSRATLAGHADLSRTYLTSDAVASQP